MKDVYDRALARLGATPFPMSEDTRREYEDMQRLLRALLRERQATMHPDILKAREEVNAALAEFVGDPQ